MLGFSGSFFRLNCFGLPYLIAGVVGASRGPVSTCRGSLADKSQHEAPRSIIIACGLHIDSSLWNPPCQIWGDCREVPATMVSIPQLEYTNKDAIPDIVDGVRAAFHSQKTKPLEWRKVQLRKLYWG